MKYRKKPIIIEAVQVTDEWFDGDHPNPLHPVGTPEHPIKILPQLRVVEIITLECDMYASTGDWIITGVQGERYPCKPDIFEQTYEAVEP